MNTAEILYRVDTNLSPHEYRDLLIRSTLGKIRPIDNLERLEKMCKHANLIITARLDGRLIGVSRALTDFAFSTYLSDLAVDEAFQRRGIGKQLIAETKKQAPQATITLLAAPEAIEYYPRIGMSQYEFCYRLKNLDDLQ